jgi:cytochrome c
MKRIILTALTLILFLLLVVGVTARLGWLPVSATAVPSYCESAFGQAMLQASLSRQAAGLTNPIRPSNEVLITGLKIFKMNCAGCHGSRGQPSQWGTKISIHVSRNSRIIHPIYQRLRCLSRLSKEFATAEWALGNGMMSDEEIWKVATFLEHIGSLPPEVEANWKTTQ